MSNQPIVWESPAPSKGGRPPGSRGLDWASIAEALRSRPGDWALVAEGLSNSLPNHLNSGKSPHFPRGEYEFVSRDSDSNRKGKIYGRFIGQQVSS